MTTTLTNDMENSYYFNIIDALDYLDYDYINHAKSLLFDIYDVDDTIFDDNRRFTKLFYVAFKNENLYFMRLLLNLGLNVNNYMYNSNNRKYNTTIFNRLIQQILDSYNGEYTLVRDEFIVQAFKLIFEYSKIDYKRGDINYYDLLYSDNGYSYMDKQRLINLLEIAKNDANTYMAKQRLALGKVDSMLGEYLDIDTLNTLGKSLMHQSFDPNISFNRNNPYETYGDYLKSKSILERKKYMQKHSNRKFAKRTRKKRKPKRF
tara:strand:+ start:270 stop:1055 length:786 start_codon:yes stop_codon:yes gene_type:complete